VLVLVLVIRKSEIQKYFMMLSEHKSEYEDDDEYEDESEIVIARA
jgi:hypothetical protein